MVACERELFQDCQVLFGGDLNVSRNFLEYLQSSGVKKAYRTRVKETHPDKLAQEGRVAQAQGARRFQRVQKSYERLSAYLKARENGFSFQRSSLAIHQTRRPSTAPVRPTAEQPPRPQYNHSRYSQESQKARTSQASKKTQENWQYSEAAYERFKARSRKIKVNEQSKTQVKNGKYSEQNKTRHIFHGDLPNRPMLFGHFLYYSGLIDWQTIVKALVWQRAERPRIGDIGIRFGWLNSKEVLELLSKPTSRDLFGRRAVESGMISKSQLMIILNYQRSQQKMVGEYFVINQIFSKQKLSSLLEKCHAHNRQQNINKRRQKAS